MANSDLFKSIRICLFGGLAAGVIRLLYATIRWEMVGSIAAEEQLSDSKPQLWAFWHGRMLMLPRYYMAVRGRRRKVTPYMLISRHGDGRLIAFAVRLLGISSVAGSSSRGGVAGLLELLKRVEQGSDVGVTPDGPRGPRQVCKKGIAAIAQKGAIPVCPVSYSAEQRWQFRSWDGMILPKPFSRGVIVRGAPINVGPDDDLDAATQRIEEALNEVTSRADEYWHVV